MILHSTWTSLNSRAAGMRECHGICVTEKQESGQGTSEMAMGGMGKDSVEEMSKNNV